LIFDSRIVEAGGRKSFYLPVSSNAIKLRVLIPEIQATKLMKFDTSTIIKDITQVLLKKHRFDEGDFPLYVLYHKGPNEALDLPLDNDKTIASYKMKDWVSNNSCYLTALRMKLS
jgi:hypothetical protein